MLVLATLWTNLEPIALLFAGIVGLAYVNTKGQAGYALENLERVNRLLRDEAKQHEKERAEYLSEIDTLRSSRDLTLALQPIALALEAHDSRMSELFDRHLALLERIAEQLGPESE